LVNFAGGSGGGGSGISSGIGGSPMGGVSSTQRSHACHFSPDRAIDLRIITDIHLFEFVPAKAMARSPF
jgi:hypothetical protein